MKKQLIPLLLTPALFLMGACGETNSSQANPYLSSSSGEPTSSQSVSEPDTSLLSVDSSSSTSSASSTSSSLASIDPETITDLSVENIAYADHVFTISGAGTFTFTGEFEGNIVIEAGDDDEVELDFDDFTISSSSNSPIYCTNADSLKIKLQKGTSNYVYDDREQKSEDDDSQGGGAIYSKCDLKFTGKGSLKVVGNYNNGIHGTKDVEFKSTVNDGSQIQIQAINNAIKGNDSVSIESGNIIAISTGGDGVQTEDSDVSSKGNQRGTFTMSGGQLDVYACCDGIQASYNAVIENGSDDEGNTTVPVLNIFTSNYSSYSGEVANTSTSDIYLRSNEYSSSFRYAVYFQNSDGTSSWANAEYVSSQQGGGNKPGNRTTYYYYKVEKPSKATSLQVYKFASSSTENNASDAIAKMSSSQSVNSSLDTLTINVSSSSITTSGWTTYSTTNNPGGGMGPGGGMNDGNNEKSEYSAKGIKAENLIEIDGGVIAIKSYDDGIHANYGTSLDNGSIGLGDVLINDGSLEVYAADDGIHADRYLTVKGGEINVTNSYEGFEGNYISIAGGYSKVYGTDDGLNAANKAGLTPVIDISDGIIDVTVYGNDVDAIDSNGSYKQSGGFVITKGANSNMSTGLDVDSTATISGGTFVCFGNPEKTPSTSDGVSKVSRNGTYSIGDYLISNGTDEVSVTTKYSYSVVWVYAETPSSVTITKK